MMMVPDFSPAHAGEELLRSVRANATRHAVRFAVVDSIHSVATVQLVP